MAATPHANRFEQDRQPLVWVAPVLIFSTAALLAWVIYRAVSSTLVGEFAAIRLGIWLQLFLLLFSGGMLTILALRLSPPLRMYLPAAWLGVFLFLVVALPLHSTSFPLDGIGGDQRLYSAYVAKFAATADNVDVIYPSLPAFYPPLYYYVLGRLSAWLSIAPYTMLKFGMLATAAALPLLLAGSILC